MTHNQQIKNWKKSYAQASETKSLKHRHSAINALKQTAYAFYDNTTNKTNRKEWQQILVDCKTMLHDLATKIENENKNAEIAQS